MNKTGLNFELPNVFLLNGRARSGKTYLLKFLVHYLKDRFNRIILFSPSAGRNQAYNWLSKKYQYQATHELDKQIANIKKNKKEILKTNKNHQLLIILDDCLGLSTFSKGSLVNLFTTFRHDQISIILTSQFLNKVPPVIRANSAYIFLFKTRLKQEIEAVYKNFLTDLENVKKAEEFINKMTSRDYEWLLIQQFEDNERYKRGVCPSIPEFYIKY